MRAMPMARGAMPHSSGRKSPGLHGVLMVQETMHG